MKRVFKLLGSVVVLVLGILTALPVFGLISAAGPVVGVVFWLGVAVVLAWLFIVRRGASGSASESSMLHQKSKEGLL